MNKDQVFMYLAGFAAAVACWFIWNTSNQIEFKVTSENHVSRAEQRAIVACKNAAWQLNGETLALLNGVAEVASSSSKLTFKHRAARGYVDNDNFPDLACLYTLETGGSGTFYYVGYLKGLSGNMYQPTATQLLGDRVNVTDLSIDGSRIKVNYVEHKLETPFTSEPDFPHIKHFNIEDDQFTTAFDSGNPEGVSTSTVTQ